MAREVKQFGKGKEKKVMKTIDKRLTEMRKSPSAAISSAMDKEDSKPLSSVATPKQKIKADLGNVSFAEAFRAARKNNPGQPFTWRGKSYSTAMAGEGKTPAKRQGTAGAGKRDTTSAAPSTSGNRAVAAMKQVVSANANKPKPVTGAAAPARTSTATPTPARNIDRFNFDKVREMSARMDSKKGTTFGGAFKAKGGKVKKYNKGGMPKESTTGSSTTKPVTPDAAKQRREFEEEMRKRNQQAQNEGKAIGRTGPRHAKGGNVMKKSDKAGRALAKKPADTMGRAMMKKAGGGKCYAKGGSIDGIAKKGKTKGKMC